MQAYPHHYRASAAGGASGDVELTSPQLPLMLSSSPAEFDGPGNRWSPETMLVGAVADCFILTFRAMARASQLAWDALTCDVTGTLDRADHTVQFTRFDVTARLVVPDGKDLARAQHLLEKAERSCLITNSLKAEIVVDARVQSGRATD